MARANYKDQYASTGWAKALGRVSSTSASTGASAAWTTRKANAEARTVAMGAIIDRVCGPQFSPNSQGEI